VVDKKISKEARHALDLSLKVLEHAMELASEKEELEPMIAIADRLMILYQHLSDKNVKKFKAGFAMSPIIRKTETQDEEEYEEEDDEFN